ncbi:MAG TPA: hypothetical protein VK676_11865 [Steroidobacteraceae bacterium]|jgi:hypothetical protein|nr:hypothetical protein [Steroidobacteraceae bacterium]
MDKKLPIDKADKPQGDSSLPGTTGIGRRKAVTYLAVGLGLAVAGVLKPRRAEADYGRCFRSGCGCCGFEGSNNLCSNCGHQYSDHGGMKC